MSRIVFYKRKMLFDSLDSYRSLVSKYIEERIQNHVLTLTVGGL